MHCSFLFSSKEQQYDQIDDGSSPTPSPGGQIPDMEDMGSTTRPNGSLRPMATKRKRSEMEAEVVSSKSQSTSKKKNDAVDLSKSWKEVLGDQPEWGPSKVRTPYTVFIAVVK